MSGFVNLRENRGEKLSCCWFFVLAIYALGVSFSVCAADEKKTAEAMPRFDYRRLYVPADTPEEWPVGSERYVPISTSEFSQLIDPLASRGQPNQATDVRVTSVVYKAKLAKDNVLDGSAVFDVRLTSKSARLLSFGPLDLAVTTAYWQQEPMQAVHLALWNRDSVLNHELAILVKHPGTLHLDWQLQAKEASGDILEYEFKVPVVTSQTFSLTLPSRRSASFSTGELVSTEDLPNERTRWVFQLGPSDVHRLSISQSTSLAPLPKSARISRVSEYRLDPQGLSLTTRFRMGAGEPISEERLRFSVPERFRVLSVTIEQEEVEWHLEKNAGGTEIVTEIATWATPQIVEIRGLAKIVFDQPWQLPALLATGTTWTEGTSSLRISPALELRSLVPQRASLVHIIGLETNKEESYRLQEWTEDATFEVLLGKRTARVSARTATILDLDPADIDDSVNLFEVNPNDTRARTISVFSCQGRPIHQLQGELAPGWSMESIQTSPNDVLREWHVYRKGNRRLFRIQLDHPLEPGNSLRIECDSRATQEGSLLPATANELVPVRFTAINQLKHLLLLRSQKRGQLELLHGLDKARLQIDTLDAEDVALLPEIVDGALIDLTRLSSTAPIKLLPRSTQYRAEVRVEVSVTPDTLVHHYQLDCTPISGIVSELVIGFNEPLPESTRWKVAGQPGAIVARRLDQVATRPSVSGQGILYLVRLPVAIEAPFQLLASYSMPADDTQKCNLIHLPNAVDWQGELVVRGPLSGILLDDRGWTPVAATVNEQSDHSLLPTVGCYRLGSDRAGSKTTAATLTITRNEENSNSPNLIARMANLRSFLSADGTVIYVATYHLENSGAPGAECLLPPQAKLQDAWLNQQQLDPREILVDDRTCRFHFSDQRRYPTIAMQYVLQGKPLGHSTKIKPELPHCSYPIEYGRWTLWTPEHFIVEGFSNLSKTSQLNWSTRLFGPLGRRAGEGMFNPLDTNDWRRLRSAGVEHHLTSRLAERVSQALAEHFERDGEQRWAEILHVVNSESADGEKLRIDRLALEALGIRATSRLSEVAQLDNKSNIPITHESTSKTLRAYPRTELEVSSGREYQPNQTVLGRAVSPLERCRLSLVTTPNLTILTSLERKSQWRDQLRPTITPNVYQVSSKSLAQRLEKIAQGQADQSGMAGPALELDDVDRWTDSLSRAKSPWQVPAASLVSDLGRRAATLEFADTPPAVVVYRENGQRAQWYAVWLLVLVISSRQLVRFPRYFVLAIAISAATCLIVPASWLPLPQAIFLGLLSSVLVQLFLPRTTPALAQLSSYRTASRIAFVVFIFGGSLLAGYAFAETTEDAELKSSFEGRTKIHRVLIPVDADGKTQGDDIYLSEEFFQTLQGARGDARRDGAQFALRSIQYRGTLPVASRVATSARKSWAISLDIESFVTHGKFHLPFRRDEAEWIDTAHRLDGFPVELEWEADGIGCSIELNTKGNHRLELSVRPKVTRSSNQAQILFHVPAKPGSTLALTSPSGFRNLSIPTAGQIDIDRTNNRLKTVLAANETLEVHWSASPTSNDDSRSLGSVDQLTWLHVDPAAARLDVQLQLYLKNENSRRFLLVVSPELKLLSPKSSSPIESAAYLPDRRHTIEIILKPNVGNVVTIPIQFQLQRTVSVGRIDYPWIQIPDFTLNRSMFAVSVSAGLSYDESLRSDAATLQSADFVAKWHDDREPPLYAYALGEDGLDGSLRIWPDPKTLTVQQSMKVHCRLEKTLVDFNASINEVSGIWLTYQLRVPAELQVEDVTVQQRPSLASIPVRWSRVSDSRVVVFLGQPLQESHLLTLRGHIKTPADRVFAVPTVTLIKAKNSDIHMDLSRDSDVLVNWVDPDQAPEEISQTGISLDTLTTLVGSYLWRDLNPSSLSRLQIARNRRRFDAAMATTLSSGPIGWTGTAHTLVQVQEGVLSQLTFAVPNTFQKPYRIEPASLASVRERIDRFGRKYVTAELKKTLSKDKEIAFHLTGNIDLTADQRLIVPNLRLMEASRVDRYVLLPNHNDEHSIHWDRTGLTPESLPTKIGKLLESQNNTRAFRIDHEQFFARQRSYQGTLQNAMWRYTVVSCALDHKGNLSATAELIMQPGRATHCTIRLPENAELTQLATGDSRVRREKTKEGSWRIPLGPPYLPRRITVSYQVRLSTSGGRFKLPIPSLLIDDRPLPSPETRWKIRPIGTLSLADPIVGRPLLPEQFSRATLQLSLNTLSHARLLALDLPKQEGQDWFKSWQRRTQQAWEEWHIFDPASETLEELAATTFGSNPVESENDSHAWSLLLEQLGEPDSSLKSQQSKGAYPPILPDRLDTHQINSEHFYLSGPEELLVIDTRPASPKNGWRWFFAVMMVSGSFAITRKLRASNEWMTPLREQPNRLIIAIGLAWWLLLAPSVAGLLLVVGAMLISLRRLAKRFWRPPFQNA